MAETRKTTIKEIAQRANVSPSLVSCILNGKGRVSEKVRIEVTAMLQAAGHRPKYVRRPVFFLLDSPGQMSHHDHIRELAGIQSLFAEESCTLLVDFLPAGNPGKPAVEEIFERIALRKPGGVFICSGSRWFQIALKVLRRQGVPLVQIGFDIEEPGCSAVVIDSFSGVFEAVRYLIAQGHTRIATIRWQAHTIRNTDRKHAGYLAALSGAGIAARPEYIRSINAHPFTPQWVLARDVLKDLLALPEPPTALFVENSAISASLLYPLVGDVNGIPADIRKIEQIHFEDLPLDQIEDTMVGQLLSPPRDTCLVAVDWHALGRMAARVMLDRIAGLKIDGGQVVRVCPVLQRVRGHERTDVCQNPPEAQ